jgi:hypothetical protein
MRAKGRGPKEPKGKDKKRKDEAEAEDKMTNALVLLSASHLRNFARTINEDRACNDLAA